MANKSLNELNEQRAALVKKLAKVDVKIAQAGFVDLLKPGVYVHGSFGEGEDFSNAKILGVQEPTGTSGAWFKLRVNEDTVDEQVRSVRLSAIHGIVAAEAADAASSDAE